MKILAMLFLLMIPMTASSTNEVNTWWESEYKQTIEPEQQRQQDQEALDRCLAKIAKYKRKLEESPDDVYVMWRLRVYTKKCGDEIPR